MSSIPLLEVWYQAARANIGVVVVCDPEDTERLRTYLYRARKEAGDPALSELSIFSSPSMPGEIWVTRQVIETESEAEALRKDLKDV